MNKRIDELPAASQIGVNDLFVAEQGEVAKSVSGALLKSGIETMVEPFLNAHIADAETAAENAETSADNAEASKTAIENMTATATQLGAGVNPTVTKTIVDGHVNLAFGIPQGPKGERGEKGYEGKSAEVLSSYSEYAVSESGTVIPSVVWAQDIPPVRQGWYLWIKNTVTFNVGSPAVFYSTSRMGVDGSGSVSSVNNNAPDSTGNVTVGITDISGLEAALENAGSVKTVNDVEPDADGNVQLDADDVGALPNSNNSVQSNNINDGAVTAVKIASNAVTSEKIATGAVSTDFTVSVPATGWTGEAAPYTKTVEVTGIFATDTPIADVVVPDNAVDDTQTAWALIYRITTADGSITLYASEIPSTDLTIKLKAVRK